MAKSNMTPPTPPDKSEKPSDLLTTTTTTEKLADIAALFCIISWAVLGIGIGIVLVWAAPFPLQLIIMISYVVFSVLGWLPWQWVDK